MNRETRIHKIQEIIEAHKKDPFGKIEIPWEDDLVTMDVYKIPLDLLVYNKYNGRILSRTKSLEKQNLNINVESKEGKELIEQLLWDSKIDRNKKTKQNLTDFGQQKVGIITKDGIIIDGNRRAMLLNKIDKFDYFKAVVLPVTLEQNRLEIEKLETSYQMGEDEKLGYNPIEKYLKAKGLLEKLLPTNTKKEAIDKIADWMGERNSSTIEEYIAVMETMDDYLDYLGYEGMYTQLDGREDQFINLTSWLNSFYGEGSKKAGWAYKDSDVDDLKTIAFDYIRIRYEGKDFRNIAHGFKENHFFGNKEIWSSFSEIHFANTSNITEVDIDYNSTNISKHLESRDAEYKTKVGELFKENVEHHYQRLRYNQEADKPEKLLKRSLDAFNSINTSKKQFSQPDVQKLVEELGNKVYSSLNGKAPSKILDHIIKLMESLKIEEASEDEVNNIKLKTKKIQQIAYQICKNI